jgi:hypothetical protein
MAQSPAYLLAHTFLPNLVKLKGAATVIYAIERKEKTYFEPVWQQAHVKHDPYIAALQRTDETASVLAASYRIGVITLPAPKDMGEAHMVGIVVRKSDPSFSRYYTLEHDYVLSKKADRTLVCEHDGQRHIKHFDGPVLTGNVETDVTAFVDAFMEILIPKRVQPKK